MYNITGKQYSLKEKYTLKNWGKILQLLNGAKSKTDDELEITINLISNGTLDEVLNLILDKELESELMESDLEVAGKIIVDFFSRKESLMSSTKKSS